MATTPAPKPTPTPAPAPPTPTHPASTPPAPTHPDEKKPEEKKAPPELPPEQAMALFRNGDRIVKVGDPKEKWLAQGRAGDGTPVVETPLTDEVLEQLKTGKYYLASHG